MPSVCVAVDPRNQVAILRSIEGREQFLLVPTIRVTGIEDPYLRSQSAPNYWELAWEAAQRYLPESVTKDRKRIGLAINSVYGRSQNQLHIHISCINADAARILDAEQNKIGKGWSAPVIELGSHTYRAIRIPGRNLDGVNPFHLGVQLPEASQRPGVQTLVLIGTTWDSGKSPGFYLLEDFAHETTDDFDKGHGEALLDENCTPI